MNREVAMAGRLTALTKQSTARPTSQKSAPEAGVLIKEWLQNNNTIITVLCNCEQEIAKLRSANPSWDTVRPGTFGRTLSLLSCYATKNRRNNQMIKTAAALGLFWPFRFEAFQSRERCEYLVSVTNAAQTRAGTVTACSKAD
jgi:hypothetical protein